LADDKSIYGLTAAGELLWYPSWTDFSLPPNVTDGKQVGIGWGDFAHVFPGGDGILYAVTKDGALLWYRDDQRDGSNDPSGNTGWAAASGSQIGTGWAGFSHLFSGGDGVIYAVRATGELLWYQDLKRDGSNDPSGSTGWAAASGNQIGTGWNGFRHLIPGGGGVMYAVSAKGDLLWYRDDQRDGSNDPSGSTGWAPGSAAKIGNGWGFFTHLFSGDAGVIFACRAGEFGGTIHRYRDLLMDGTNTAAAGGWLTADATARGGWQISGIEGYCWPLSVAAGETVRFHVSAMTPGTANVSYVRLGGRGPQLGVHVERGIDLEADFNASGRWDTDCSWPIAFDLCVPLVGSWEPGFYAARVQGPSGPPFDIPFVVRRGPAAAPLALLVNVNTWNAYNTWGGASNYSGTASPINLTLKRPNHHLLTYSRDHSNGSHMLRSEIWLHGWLKAQGYQVDLYTDVDLESGIDRFTDYKAFILSTHPEYWTQTMIGRVEDYLDAGRSLLYLGGNGMYRPTTLAAAVAGGDLDLMTTEITLWPTFPDYEGKPLFAARVDQLVGPGRGVGLTISDRDHRFMPTGVQAGQVVGTSGWNGWPDLPWGASGWETDYWDAPLPNGVSELARDVAAVHGAVIACYETSGGGFVLGVGSLTFVGSLMDDLVLQQIVTNALAEGIAKF